MHFLHRAQSFHRMFIRSISYRLFPPGCPPPVYTVSAAVPASMLYHSFRQAAVCISANYSEIVNLSSTPPL